MNKKIWWYVGAAMVVGVIFGAIAREDMLLSINKPGGNSSARVSVGVSKSNNDLSLITEPNDGITPLLKMIRSASTSIDLVMYEMGDPQIEDALTASEKRGVAVRVLLNGGYYGVPDTGANSANVINQTAYAFLKSNGVAVKWTPAYFALTHQKSLVIDSNAAIVMTFNLLPQFYATGRDFGIIDRDPNDVGAIEAAFDNDWNGNQAVATSGDDLAWSPGSESAIFSIINNTKTSLDVYNEEMADDDVTAALIAAAKRGVAVRIDMTDSSEWDAAFRKLSAAGVEIRTYAANAPLYIHAKMIVADDAQTNAQAFVGSQNFSYTSLTNNRELGITFTNAAIIKSLEITFANDWKNATPFNE